MTTIMSLETVMEHYPELTYFGMGLYHEREVPLAMRHVALQEKRQQLLDAQESFGHVARVFAHIGKRRTVSKGFTSYGLKHLIEDFIGDYVANGTCIAAAVACGFAIQRCHRTSPNVYVNMVAQDLQGLRGAQASQDLPLTSQQVPPALRFVILQRDGYRCRLCGIAARDGTHVRLEVDHITPRIHGGTKDPSNLWTLCFACNRGKGARAL